MIEAKGIVKNFGRRQVLTGLDLTVGDGQIVALMGPNGAGKTTLLRIMATLVEPTSGDVVLGGTSVFEDPVAARRAIGVIGHSTYTYDDLTALENIRFFWSMYGLPKDGFGGAARDILRRVGLSHRMNDRVAIFSKGMRQRLAVARAVLHSPKVLLLDEPFSSLDQKGAEILTQILREERDRGCSILVITHDAQRVVGLADRADILIKGKIARSLDRAALGKGVIESAYVVSAEGGMV